MTWELVTSHMPGSHTILEEMIDLGERASLELWNKEERPNCTNSTEPSKDEADLSFQIRLVLLQMF